MEVARRIWVFLLIAFLPFAIEAGELVPLPSQDEAVPWPTVAWPENPIAAEADQEALGSLLDYGFSEASLSEIGDTRALVIIHRGRLVVERYASGFGPDRRFLSQSMAKSFVHALVGILVRDGKLTLGDPAPVSAWRKGDDPRRAITIDNLLQMSGGLDFVEDYINPYASDVLPMLFGRARGDAAGFAASFPLIHEPGTHWSYSSGTTNIVSGVIRDTVGGTREEYSGFMHRELFDLIGMTSALAEFDASGTFVGSSHLHATARDYAKFGLLYLRGGVWDGKRVLPQGWADYARTPIAHQGTGKVGAHFWLNAGNPAKGIPPRYATAPADMFMAQGFGGQVIAMVPSKDIVVVRLGRTSEPLYTDMYLWLGKVIGAFPDSHSAGVGAGAAVGAGVEAASGAR